MYTDEIDTAVVTVQRYWRGYAVRRSPIASLDPPPIAPNAIICSILPTGAYQVASLDPPPLASGCDNMLHSANGGIPSVARPQRLAIAQGLELPSWIYEVENQVPTKHWIWNPYRLDKDFSYV